VIHADSLSEGRLQEDDDDDDDDETSESKEGGGGGYALKRVIRSRGRYQVQTCFGATERMALAQTRRIAPTDLQTATRTPPRMRMRARACTCTVHYERVHAMM